MSLFIAGAGLDGESRGSLRGFELWWIVCRVSDVIGMEMGDGMGWKLLAAIHTYFSLYKLGDDVTSPTLISLQQMYFKG